MVLLDTIKTHLDGLETKEFYRYLIIFFASLALCLGLIIFYRYHRVSFWKKKINEINELREEVQRVIDKDEQVVQQRKEVDVVLAENQNFKIEGYFLELLSRLHLEQNKKSTSITYADRGDQQYREVLLSAEFDMMNMMQLCQLLQETEQNKMIYAKDLKIIKSKRNPGTIEVNLTIATLQLKPTEALLTE